MVEKIGKHKDKGRKIFIFNAENQHQIKINMKFWWSAQWITSKLCSVAFENLDMQILYETHKGVLLPFELHASHGRHLIIHRRSKDENSCVE